MHAEGAEVLVGHWALSGSTTPTGADVSSFREPIINSAALADIGYAVCVFGHIHKRQWIDEESPRPVMFLGSPWAVDWGEWDSPHCVTWLYREQKGFWAVEPVHVPDTRFVTLDVGPAYPPRDREVSGAVVRVRWRGTREQYADWDAERYTESLLREGALRVASVQADFEQEARARVEGLTESAEPADALDAYITARDTPEDLAARARVAHTEIVEGL
jgi:DNA repair exonuclease SbcCD nuclease subunit